MIQYSFANFGNISLMDKTVGFFKSTLQDFEEWETDLSVNISSEDFAVSSVIE